MDITIKKIGNLYQIDDNETPIEAVTLREMLSSITGGKDAEISKLMDNIDSQGELSLKTEANTGIVVDLYEVDYPAPADPEKSTQDLASHLDEKKDFVTQYLFPDSHTEDVIVGLRQDLMENEKMPTPSSTGKSAASNKLNFKIAWVTGLTEDQKAYVERTGKMPQGVLEHWFGMNLSNWIRFTPPHTGAVSDVCVAADVFRYILAVQSGDDVEQYSIDYYDLVEDGVNPLDLLDVLDEAIMNGPDQVDEGTTLDALLEDEGAEVKRIQVMRRSR